MNRPLPLGLAMLTGIALGATAIKGLNAQNKPPTDIVIDTAEMTDPWFQGSHHQRGYLSDLDCRPRRPLHHPDRSNNRT